MQDKFYEVVEAIYEDVCTSLEDKFYRSQIHDLRAYDMTKDVVTDYIAKILTDEKLRNKLVGNVRKTVLEKHEENEVKRRA